MSIFKSKIFTFNSYEYFLEWYIKLGKDSSTPDLTEDQKKEMLKMMHYVLKPTKRGDGFYFLYDEEREMYDGDEEWVHSADKAMTYGGVQEAFERLWDIIIPDWFEEDEDYMEDFYYKLRYNNDTPIGISDEDLVYISQFFSMNNFSVWTSSRYYMPLIRIKGSDDIVLLVIYRDIKKNLEMLKERRFKQFIIPKGIYNCEFVKDIPNDLLFDVIESLKENQIVILTMNPNDSFYDAFVNEINK